MIRMGMGIWSTLALCEMFEGFKNLPPPEAYVWQTVTQYDKNGMEGEFKNFTNKMSFF